MTKLGFSILSAVSMIMLSSVQAAGYTLLKLDNFDLTFSQLCTNEGTVNVGNNPCEYGVFEMKRGITSGLGGSSELQMRTNTFGQILRGDLTVNGSTTQNTPLETNALPWTRSSQNLYNVTWRLEGNPDVPTALQLTLGVSEPLNPSAGTTNLSMKLPQTSFTNLIPPKLSTSNMEQLWIRLAGVPNQSDSSVTISKIFANGTLNTLADPKIETSSGLGSPYFLLFGVDFSQNWYVEGTATFNLAFGTGSGPQERPAINWKFTQDIGDFQVASVPEPDTLYFLVGTVLSIPWVRRNPRCRRNSKQ